MIPSRVRRLECSKDYINNWIKKYEATCWGEKGVGRLKLLDCEVKNSLNLKVLFGRFFKKGDIWCCHSVPNQIDKLENCKKRSEKIFEVSEKFRHFYTHARFFIFPSLIFLTLFIQESMSLLFWIKWFKILHGHYLQ